MGTYKRGQRAVAGLALSARRGVAKAVWVALLACLALSVESACGSNGTAGNDAPRHDAESQGAPVIAPVDQRFLTQVARRTLAARLTDGAAYEVGYVPPALADIACQMMVTLRVDGYARGIGTSEKLPVVEAVQQAAIVALSSGRSGPQDDVTALDNVRLELQALGPPVEYAGAAKWTEPGAIRGFLDPGLDGVRLFLDGEARWFTPGEMISRSMSLDEALRTLGKEITLDSRVLSESALSRFRALHWWETDGDGHVSTLRRGMVVVPLEDVNRRTVDAAIRELAGYICYRQRPNGWFASTFNPATDAYALEDDALMQAGACWALAEYARRTGESAAAEHLERGLRAQQSAVVGLGRLSEAAFVAAPDQNNRLAITAEHCLALALQPDAARHAGVRARLVAGMLWLQREDGHLLTVFPPALAADPQENGAGAALVALAECYRLTPSAEVADALARALGYYRRHFAETGALGMAPWHATAYARMAERTRRSDYAEYVYALCDRVCDNQLRLENNDSPELWGAIANDQLAPGSATAAFVEGLAEGAVLARAQGDTARHARYVEACRQGVRFILQLQFKAEECYYVRSPRDAIGGIRSTPTNVRLHLDSAQHSLIALLKARDLLFPEQP